MIAYLDNSATTPVDEQTAQLIYTMLTQNYGNPSSLHKKGLEAQLKVDAARAAIAKTLYAQAEEIYFTGSGSESNNLALQGAANAKKRRGNKIVATAFEHSSVMNTLKYLEKNGFQVEYIYPGQNGLINAQNFINAVDGNTVLATCMLVNNETGAVSPLADIIKGIRRKNSSTLIHSDAVQAYGKLDINVKKLDVDMLTISGHKIYAPKGIGALYIKKGVRIAPIIYGGSQEGSMRAGTENTAYICGFAYAAQQAAENIKKNLEHAAGLKERLISRLSDIQGISINSPQNSLPYIANISVNGIRSEIMLHYLEQFEVYVSSGSACAKGAKSHVLKAAGLSDDKIDTALGISFGYKTTLQ